ncbi:MAG: FAD-binding protein [Thermomicrobiales bacterium]
MSHSLAARSGGHSLASLSVIENALVVDLSLMNHVRVDPAAGIARVQPATTSADLGRPARVHAAYPPVTHARLEAIKHRYDPANLFRFSQNVPPRRRSGSAGRVSNVDWLADAAVVARCQRN